MPMENRDIAVEHIPQHEQTLDNLCTLYKSRTCKDEVENVTALLQSIKLADAMTGNNSPYILAIAIHRLVHGKPVNLEEPNEN